MFGSWKQKIQNRNQLEIALSKLSFLANEFVNDRDRPNDVYHWNEQLRIAEELNDKSFGVNFAIESYRLLFSLFLKKHGYQENEIKREG